MRKEILFAIVAGGAFGLAIAFGAWKLNSSIKSKPKTTTDNSQTATQNATSTDGEFKIILEKPNNLSLFTDTPVDISGITNPNSWVIVSGSSDDTIINASSSGSFSANVDLEGGENQIILTAFDNNGNSTTSNLDLIYSSQFTKDASKSADPLSYIGTITDITNSIIQIKNSDGDIQQIVGTDNAAYIDTRGQATKTLKASDIAIGDYLVAMGYKNDSPTGGAGNNILEASRILITDTPAKSTLQIIMGTVSDDSGYNKFVMKDKDGKEFTITPGTGISINGAEISFGNIKNNEKVIVVGSEKSGNIEARTIMVLK